MALSRLVTLLISSIRNFDIEANKLYDFMIQHFLQGVIHNMLFGLILTVKLIILHILSKFNLSTKGLN